MKPPCIGLFGTCGNSQWRKPFIAQYEALNIKFFNPQVDNWTPELADVEAKHLAEDEIILFPITGETYASGGLSEVGFSILNAIKLNNRRDFVVLIDKEIDEHLKTENPVAAKESLRSRALVRAHLHQVKLDNVYFVSTLGEMLETSLKLHSIAKLRQSIQHFSTANLI